MTDCAIYENCLRNQQVIVDIKNQVQLHMVAVGCWGVYCNDGDYIITKYKKGKVEPLKVTRGQKRVARALIEYVSENKVTDMYLAGDNVYQLGISAIDEEGVVNMLKKKQELVKNLTGEELDPLRNFDIDLQISEGFQKCFAEAKIDRYFLAIGNHDIENCQILNTQYNFNEWIIPSLYYNVIYNLKNFKINIIVLDTNMFEDEPVTCLQEPFSDEQIRKQEEWALSMSKKGDWNIVIGHIPYLSNGHKKDKHPIVRQKLGYLIEKMQPHLYICADEHNQQFIQSHKTAIVIAGSGGTSLDHILDKPIPGTLYQNSDFGFVSYQIRKNELTIDFMSTQNEILFSHVLNR
jgi:hypothetical protein